MAVHSSAALCAVNCFLRKRRGLCLLRYSGRLLLLQCGCLRLLGRIIRHLWIDGIYTAIDSLHEGLTLRGVFSIKRENLYGKYGNKTGPCQTVQGNNNNQNMKRLAFIIDSSHSLSFKRLLPVSITLFYRSI